MLDANILLDSLVLEADGNQRSGKQGSDVLLDLCDQGAQHGLVAWHTLPIVAYYYRREHSTIETGAMMDSLLAFLEVPTVGHQEAARWCTHGISDFEDTLQMAAAMSGRAEVFVTRNTADFQPSPLPIMTPEEFLAAYC